MASKHIVSSPTIEDVWYLTKDCLQKQVHIRVILKHLSDSPPIHSRVVPGRNFSDPGTSQLPLLLAKMQVGFMFPWMLLFSDHIWGHLLYFCVCSVCRQTRSCGNLDTCKLLITVCIVFLSDSTEDVFTTPHLAKQCDFPISYQCWN